MLPPDPQTDVLNFLAHCEVAECVLGAAAGDNIFSFLFSGCGLEVDQDLEMRKPCLVVLHPDISQCISGSSYPCESNLQPISKVGCIFILCKLYLLVLKKKAKQDIFFFPQYLSPEEATVDNLVFILCLFCG